MEKMLCRRDLQEMMKQIYIKVLEKANEVYAAKKEKFIDLVNPDEYGEVTVVYNAGKPAKVYIRCREHLQFMQINDIECEPINAIIKTEHVNLDFLAHGKNDEWMNRITCGSAIRFMKKCDNLVSNLVEAPIDKANKLESTINTNPLI